LVVKFILYDILIIQQLLKRLNMPKIFIMTLIIFNIFTTITNAKPASTTSFENAYKNAPTIVIAELININMKASLMVKLLVWTKKHYGGSIK